MKPPRRSLMKKLSKMLLIHWYGYGRELIEFENINFLTGKTASGKSTIIDALQLVLLGDTNGNFFNKAANEKSVRTLKSYLFGENGDDGEAGFRYLRSGPFTSYVVLEFYDTERRQYFLNGFVADCYSDQNFEYKWFTADRCKIPENCFIMEHARTPRNIRQLRDYLTNELKVSFEFIDTNKRFQEVILAKYGTLKRKYLSLLKKAVPFTPITDIEKFITESVCDVKNNIRIEQMQSDIRQYKTLEADAERTQKRIEALSEIRRISGLYEADRERWHQQGYMILRAEKEEYLQEEQKLNKELLIKKEKKSLLQQEIDELTALLQREKDEMETLREELLTSDLYSRQKTLSEEIRTLTAEIDQLEEGQNQALSALLSYGLTWSKAIESHPDTFSAAEKALAERLMAMHPSGLLTTDFADISEVLSGMLEKARDEAMEFKIRGRQILEEKKELEAREANLEKGIKPYPRTVMHLKHLIEEALFTKYRKAVEVPIFADLLEIRNPKWQDAVEGYLDRQKFNLLVPETYYADAVCVLDQLKKEENIYDAGLVDIQKLRKEAGKDIRANALSEEVETEDPDARLYADYLLGAVVKCEKAEELNRFRTAITPNVTLYKNYVVRRLNPSRYQDPFIGRKSMQVLLEKCRKDLKETEERLNTVMKEYRSLVEISKLPVLSAFEAEHHRVSVEKAAKLPELSERRSSVQQEYDSIDFTWLEKTKNRIDQLKSQADQHENTSEKEKAAFWRLDEQLSSLEKKALPEVIGKITDVDARIQAAYEPDWVEKLAEPEFLKRLHDKERTQLTMLESYQRARKQTETVMEMHRVERRRLRMAYDQEFQMPFDIEKEDNAEFEKELHTLADIRLPDYIEKIRDAREKAYNQFRDDFIAKLKSNIESVSEQIRELNEALRSSVFGTDRYRFEMKPRAEYQSYYDMITDPMLLDIGGYNIASANFNEKYQREIDSLFKTLIISDSELNAERRAEYERNIRKFTDYKTYLVFDLLVTNDQGETQRLSRTLLKKSGGETQIPFYISLLASFSQTCRIRAKTQNNTLRLIILDEAFSKMDGERIQESISLLRRFGLQAVFSAPPEKIPDIAPNVDRNIAVYKSGHHSFTRFFDPAQIEEIIEEI